MSSGFVEDDAEISLVGLCLISMMMMKRRESLLCVCVFLFFLSCGDDDDDFPKEHERIMKYNSETVTFSDTTFESTKLGISDVTFVNF